MPAGRLSAGCRGMQQLCLKVPASSLLATGEAGEALSLVVDAAGEEEEEDSQLCHPLV